jgi:hypothetical protein
MVGFVHWAVPPDLGMPYAHILAKVLQEGLRGKPGLNVTVERNLFVVCVRKRQMSTIKTATIGITNPRTMIPCAGLTTFHMRID